MPNVGDLATILNHIPPAYVQQAFFRLVQNFVDHAVIYICLYCLSTGVLHSKLLHQLALCVLPGSSVSFAQWRPKFEQNLCVCQQQHGQSFLPMKLM